MTPRLLLQLGWLYHVEADAQVPDPYAWPPETRRATPEQLAEHERLRGIAGAIFERAEADMPLDAETGTDAAFGA